MQKYFTSVLVWDGSTNLMVTSPPIVYIAVLPKIFLRPKLHCDVYRLITYIKISPKGAFTITTIFLFCFSVFGSKKLWNGTGKGKKEWVVSSHIYESCTMKVLISIYSREIEY